jgi:hypothetical protein
MPKTPRYDSVKPSAHARTPYLQVVDAPREMAGSGAPRSTTFGVIGRTTYDYVNRSLGGLVHDTKRSAPVPHGEVQHAAHLPNSDRHILGPASRSPARALTWARCRIQATSSLP